MYSPTNELITVHDRSYKVFAYIKKDEHLSKNQLQMLTFDPSSLLQEAANLHPDLETYLEKVIEEKKYPEQAFKSCRAVMSLVSKVGLERLLKACRLASASGMYNYLAVAGILKNKQDELPEEEWDTQADTDVKTPEHENVRGKEYYK